MAFGDYRNIVTIEKPDTEGQWTKAANVWAKIDPEAKKVRIRYTSLLTSTCRLKWGNEVFTINDIAVMGSNRELELTCTRAQQ